MSYLENTLDLESEKNDFGKNRSTNIVSNSQANKISSEPKWHNKRDDSLDSEAGNESFLTKASVGPALQHTAGLKFFAAPVKYDDYKQVERPKLKMMDRIPQYQSNLRPPKMQKKLKLMRGPELINNSLLHRQFGIIATGGGRLCWGHFEMLRLTIGRKMDVGRMFAIWRVPAPWQPVTKKGQGQRMGGGKGAIDHYVSPVKSGRVIVEIAGKCEFAEVKQFLQQVCDILPFKAEVVSQQVLDERAIKERKLNETNQNCFSMKYVIQNNLSGCHKWLSPVDHKWFGKHL